MRAPTLSMIVRLWSADATTPGLRGAVEHVRTGERCFFGMYGLPVDATNGSVRRIAIWGCARSCAGFCISSVLRRTQ